MPCKTEEIKIFFVDVAVIGFGGAGGCAAIEAFDEGAEVVVLEKQAEISHVSNTRMSGGAYHSPNPQGNQAALKKYAKAMFSGENLPWKLEGEQSDYSDELAQLWVKYATENDAFMRNLDPQYKPIFIRGASFPHFPGAEESKYEVFMSSYTGKNDKNTYKYCTKDLPKVQKDAGEAFHACILHGIKNRNIPIHYETRAMELIINEDGEVTGVKAVNGNRKVIYMARKAVIIASGGFEYNKQMRSSFLEGPGEKGWAFYGSPENTGDGIVMALKIGAGLSKVGKASARIITAISIEKEGLKIGMMTPAIGKPNELVVDNYGNRYASERRITKDPSKYTFYKEAVFFDTVNLLYPRIPSWMVFDDSLRRKGPIVNLVQAKYNSIPWGEENLEAIQKGWILMESTIEKLGVKIKSHPENRELMNPKNLKLTVEKYNSYCEMGEDKEFGREPDTLGKINEPPFYAVPLYAGGPNTQGGLLTNAKRQVLNWDCTPIPRLYAVGEISSVFKFVYQSGGNLAECIAFGRIAGRNAAMESLFR